MPATPPSDRLRGIKVLIVEDEPIIALMIEDMLLELGCSEARHAANVAEAKSLMQESRPDVAMLDLNLAGESSDPIGEMLQQEQVPFVFVTGYSRPHIPARWASKLVVQKPFRLETLAAAVAAALSSELDTRSPSKA